ncbi:Fur family transcriptional regulator [Actinomadura litoris]|uniref:Fur family transcriptional regulator n=1 Tax=Actinomadura litoris TaxID=2678616 RepID=UPI001FA7C568|nr:Fur family transcriptional regulator [Actinomadura litoris]
MSPPDPSHRDPRRPDHARRRSWALRRVRAAGHRSTRPRALIVTVLAQAEGHLTADVVHERAAAAGTMDLSTVYRTLALFERLQIVHTLAIGKRVTYGLADHPHAHTVCDGCARVTALRGGELGDVRALVRRDLAGFAATGIVVRGRCAACRPPRLPDE